VLFVDDGCLRIFPKLTVTALCHDFTALCHDFTALCHDFTALCHDFTALCHDFTVLLKIYCHDRVMTVCHDRVMTKFPNLETNPL
jgi:hypothetical protein